MGQRLCLQSCRGLLTDRLIGVGGENRKQFDEFFRGKRSSAAANGELAFPGRASRSDLFAQFVANRRLL
jgi:hypothetical protein